MLVGQVYDKFGRGSCFLIVVFSMFAPVLYFAVVFEFLLFLCNDIFPQRTEGSKCSMEVLPGGGGGAVDAPFFQLHGIFFNCMAVSVSVADLGALATDGLICCAFVGVVVFKFAASETGDKFSELLLLVLWRSYFGVKSIQAISDDGVGCFGVFTYNTYDVKIPSVLSCVLYLNVAYVWVWSDEFVLISIAQCACSVGW